MERSRWLWLVLGVVTLLGGVLGCGSEGDSGGDGEDPVRDEILALERVAGLMEDDLELDDGVGLADLGAALEQSLTPREISLLTSNTLAFLEAARSGSTWTPDEEFYALVEGLRDLPFLSDLPARSEPSAPKEPTSRPPVDSRESGLSTRSYALVLANVAPGCGLSCAAQGTIYTLLDYGAGAVKKYYLDLLTSGVDCAQDAAKLGRCAAADSCTVADFTLFVGGCASLSLNVALEATGASKAKTAYVFLKQVLSLWSAGALASGAADWIAGCLDYQSTYCAEGSCAPEERRCSASNGAGSLCCPTASTCAECTLCPLPCGFDGCCATGQRCVDGLCQTCASSCGPTCCGEKEICANPDQGVCAPCETPCGLTCCPEGTTCLEAQRECCATPCGDECCAPGESCHPTIGECCATPCGDDCCAPGQLCDPERSLCSDPVGCDDAPAVDCQELCNLAVEAARERCTAMGGTLEQVDLAGCITDCQCILQDVPNLYACAENPSCPGCDRMEEAVARCGQRQAICMIPQD